MDGVTAHRRRLVSAALLLLTLFAAVMLTTGCARDESTMHETSSETEPAESSGDTASGLGTAQVIEEQCTLCHALARVYLQPDASDWEAIIERMDENHVAGYGAQPMPADRKAAIVEFMKSRTISEGEQIVREKCTTCHELSNITKQAQDVDWVTIVNRMIDEHGASLTVEEQQSAINFLKGQ